MLEVFHLRRRAYSDFGLYETSTEGQDDSTSTHTPSEGDPRGGGTTRLRNLSVDDGRQDTPSPSSSRSRERTRSSSPIYAAGKLAAKAFNIMVTFPQNASPTNHSCDGLENHDGCVTCIESHLTNVADTGLRIPVTPGQVQGQVKSAPSTPLTEERATRHLSRHDTFVAPNLSPPSLRLSSPSHYDHLPYLHPLPLPAHCPTPQSYRPMKLKTTTFSKHNRNLVSKAGQKEHNESRRSKAQKKSAIKSSMSLIDLVVASAEKKYRWSTVPESEDDYWMKDEVFKVKSRLVRSSSTSSINASAKETLPEQESWHGSREEEGGRKKTVSSVGDSDAMTTTDYEDEDEEGGARWRDSEVSLEKKKKLHALKNLSRSTPAMSPSGSPRHSDSEVPARLSRINKMFRKRFSSVTTNEKVINYYACAIVSDILLQGTLYITENYFAFYSNIFGYVNRTVLPIADVASIQKEKTAKFIPNAVGIQMFDGKTYVFSSLISRDSTYKFMIHTWRKSRKLTDSDSEPPFIIPGTNEDVSVEEEEEEEESELNSVDSNGDEDMVDSGPIEETSVSSRNVPVWSRSSPTIVSNSYEIQSSAANSNSGHVTPLTPLNDTFPGVSSSGTFESSKSYSKKSSQNAAPSEAQSSSNHWIVHTKIINSVLHVGVAPFQAVREGLQEITFLPKSSVLLVVSSALVFLLLASAAFMIYRVELLSQHLSFSPSDEFSSNLYEEVLRMQQKLHSATAEEVEKTLSMQIKQLATVRQSLDALTFLFNKDPSRPTPQIQENT